MRKRFRNLLWLGLGLVAAVYFCMSNYHAEKERAVRAAEAKAAQSIAVLPAGVEATWIRYVNERLAEEIQREGANLRVRTTYIGAEPTYSYVSLNYPYEIDCNSFDIGISVRFGTSEDGPSANITGAFSPDHKNEPERGVDPGSSAYENLDEKLCELIAERLVALTSSQPAGQ